jgi:hypothetical protein
MSMRICLSSTGYPPEDGGGIGTYVYNLARGLTARGHAVFVITSSRGTRDREEVADGVTVFRGKNRYLPRIERLLPGLAWSAMVARKVREYERRFGLDVVEFANWEAVGFCYLREPRRLPAVVRVHTPLFETLRLDKPGERPTLAERFACWTEKRACLSADRLTASTRYHRRYMAESYRMTEDGIDIVPLGIDLSSIPERSPRVGDGKFRILYVSRLEKRKGTRALLDAIPRVVDRHPEVELVLVGSDRPHAPGGRLHRDYFAERHARYSKHVRFLGFLPQAEIERWYRDSDLFVVPSVYESFGLVYVEAMSRGLPVIGGNAGGIPEVIADRKTGYLVAGDDPGEVARRIVELIEDRDLRERMALDGRERARDLFSRERMVETTERLYERVVASARRSLGVQDTASWADPPR